MRASRSRRCRPARRRDLGEGRGGVAHPPLPVPDRPQASLTVSSRIYADSGNLKDARANNFQLLPCFCQTCSTPILVLVTLPSSSLSDTQR